MTVPLALITREQRERRLSSKVAGEMCERKGLLKPLVVLGCWAKCLKNKKNRIPIRIAKNFIKEN